MAATFVRRRFGILVCWLALLGAAPGFATPAANLVTQSYDLNQLVPRLASPQPLIDLICNTVAPETWDVVGGPAKLELTPNGRLAILHEPAVHATLNKLLTAIKAAGRQKGRKGDQKHIVVTPADAAGENRATSIVVYDVSDLVQFAEGGNLQESVDKLQSTIAPTSWNVVGGQACVTPYGATGVFVIRQSEKAHQAIEDFLQAARAQGRR
jgi:hypothetical protein